MIVITPINCVNDTTSFKNKYPVIVVINGYTAINEVTKNAGESFNRYK